MANGTSAASSTAIERTTEVNPLATIINGYCIGKRFAET
jgi:hypothetical protein